MTNKYDLLILDYGGTYSFEYDVINFDKIMQIIFGKLPTAKDKLSIIELSKQLAKDSISTTFYLQSIATLLTVPVPSEQLFETETLAVTNPPSACLKELVKEVRSHEIKVSLLSNMYKFEVLQTIPTGRYDGFDFLAFSSIAKMTKSEPAFFKATLRHFGFSPDRVLFVDDVLEYVSVARSVGLKTIHADKAVFANAEQLAKAIREELFSTA